MSRTDQIKMQFQRTMLLVEACFTVMFFLLALITEPRAWFIVLGLASGCMLAYRIRKVRRMLFPPIPPNLYVCARSWAEALDYGASLGYSRHRVVYVTTPDQLRGMRGSNICIHFIGSWSVLPKAMDVYRMMIAQCLDFEMVQDWNRASRPAKAAP